MNTEVLNALIDLSRDIELTPEEQRVLIKLDGCLPVIRKGEDTTGYHRFYFISAQQLARSPESPVRFYTLWGHNIDTRRKYLEMVPISVWDAAKIVKRDMLEENEQLVAVSKEKEQAIRARLEKDIVTDIHNSDFSKPVDDLSMKRSFIEKGVYVEDKKFISYYSYVANDICTPMKKDIDNEDILLFIPRQWTKYVGYDDKFVTWYIDQVKKLTGATVEILTENGTFKGFVPERSINNQYLTDNSFYVIRLAGDDHYMLRYFVTVLLRFLYHSSVNHLPGLTAQLMEHFNTDDFFKCLLMAHSSRILPNRYSLTPEITDPGHYRFPCPQSDVKEFFHRIIKEKSLSTSLDTLSISTEQADKLSELFAKKDFDSANAILKTAERHTLVESDKRKQLALEQQKRSMPQPIDSLYRKARLGGKIETFNPIVMDEIIIPPVPGKAGRFGVSGRSGVSGPGYKRFITLNTNGDSLGVSGEKPGTVPEKPNDPVKEHLDKIEKMYGSLLNTHLNTHGSIPVYEEYINTQKKQHIETVKQAFSKAVIKKGKLFSTK